MRHATYLLLLLGCVVVTLPLELLGTRVYVRWPRLLASVLPVAVVFAVWDAFAVHAGWWRYDPAWLAGFTLPGQLPVEEALFFLVIPTCAIFTLEAVRARRPNWLIGDERP